jgi:putative phosphoesterase
MRVLVVSDIHANLAALEAVIGEPHDAVICLGDLVGYGPHPAGVVRWARSQRWVVQGNHDRAYGEGVAPGCREQFRWLAEAVALRVGAGLSDDERHYLRDLPHWASCELDGVRYLCVHATPSDPLYRYLGPHEREWTAELAQAGADVLLVGHTHLQFDLRLGRGRVVNPGSVGQPKDGDPRAAYAVIENGLVELKRAVYPVARTIRALRDADIPAPALDLLAALLQAGRLDDAPTPDAPPQAASRSRGPG